MYHRLKPFFGKNDILFKSQYGLCEKHSTQHAIIDIVNVIQNNMDQKLFTCGIFLDLKKAFDTVDLDLASKTESLWHQRNYQLLVCLVPSWSFTSNRSRFYLIYRMYDFMWCPTGVCTWSSVILDLY